MVDLVSAVTSTVGNLIGATGATTASSVVQEMVTNVALGAASSAILAAVQHPDVQKALNPLGLTLPGVAPAPAATPAAAPVAAKTIVASVFGTLPPASQTLMLSEGYSVIAG